MNPLLPLISILQLFLSPVVSGLGCRDWRNREACTAVLAKTWPLVEVVGYNGADAEMRLRMDRVRRIGAMRRQQTAHTARIANLIFSRPQWTCGELLSLGLLLAPSDPSWAMPWSADGSTRLLNFAFVRVGLAKLSRDWKLVKDDEVLALELPQEAWTYYGGCLNVVRWRLRGCADCDDYYDEGPAHESWARARKLGWR